MATTRLITDTFRRLWRRPVIDCSEALRQALLDAWSSLAGANLSIRVSSVPLMKSNRADISVALQHLGEAQAAAAGMCMTRQNMSYVHHGLPITNWAGSSWQDQR
ncbi:hypothetical protein [Bradyrhizobium sp. SZCCHNR1043]|uniref:hypothetical protein n=1 Tax=Bradyrhizobium sp. SZCCHNR1043 TaxID=3057351 RepID=UPI002915CFB2|nr:hypothetical protein [Bradyrhizobium sp. SZCCHNR1043]